MSDWTPGNYSKDPMVNAVLNVARELSELSAATRGLLYGLKYSKDNGLSMAEAIEVSMREASGTIASAIERAGTEVAEAQQGIETLPPGTTPKPR